MNTQFETRLTYEGKREREEKKGITQNKVKQVTKQFEFCTEKKEEKTKQFNYVSRTCYAFWTTKSYRE